MTHRGGFIINDDLNIMALVKGVERYVFMFDDASRVETLRHFGRYASNPELSFSWYDAAVLSTALREPGRRGAHEPLLVEPQTGRSGARWTTRAENRPGLAPGLQESMSPGRTA